MKNIIFILAIATLAAASPVPSDEVDNNRTFHQEKIEFDIKELDLELFPNGTVKLGSMDDLLQLYYFKKGKDDYAGKRTDEHFEKEDPQDDEDEEENGRSKRTIFDDDERLPIPNSHLDSALPYCALAVDESTGCTAIFIGPNQALTAGRCVYDRSNRRFRSRSLMRVYRGRNCYRRGTYMGSVTNLYAVNGYALSGQQEYDYGLIITSRRSPCWASLGYLEPWTNAGFGMIGYPTDKRSRCLYYPAYSSSCYTSSVIRDDLFLRHRCDASGMIGAPLISEFGDVAGFDLGQQAVFGVNVYTGTQYNYGPRINRDRFYQILNWMRLSGYNP